MFRPHLLQLPTEQMGDLSRELDAATDRMTTQIGPEEAGAPPAS